MGGKRMGRQPVRRPVVGPVKVPWRHEDLFKEPKEEEVSDDDGSNADGG